MRSGCVLVLLLAVARLIEGDEFNIGVVHGIEDSMVWHNVKHAIDEWNEQNIQLPVPITLHLISPTDPFAPVDERFCDVIQRQLIGMVVPADALSGEELTLVFSMCNRYHMPCLTTNDRMLNSSSKL
jgi:hypothetical protein